MRKRTASPDSADTALTPATLRATPDGTARYAARFEHEFVSDFYRTSTLGLRISSIGIGTYLGDCSDADDARYTTSIRRALTSGINLIDTAINYRCQRSEIAAGAAIEQAIASG